MVETHNLLPDLHAMIIITNIFSTNTASLKARGSINDISTEDVYDFMQFQKLQTIKLE